MHGDAQFNCSTSKKGCQVSQLPDHDILTEYGLIVNRFDVSFSLGVGGGGGESCTYKSYSMSYTPINSNAGWLQRTNCPLAAYL